MPDPNADSDWYGDIWIRYPQSQILWPMHLGHIVEAVAKFRTIMNELGFRFFSKSGAQGELTLKEAFQYKSRLDSWYEHLPDTLAPGKIVFPAQLKIQ